MSPSKVARSRSGGALKPEASRDSKGKIFAEMYKIDVSEVYTPKPSTINGKSIESLQLENEHLNGIITALNLKVRKTKDLEEELASLRLAIRKGDEFKKDLLETIDNQA
jgi:hypothetical protein